MASIAVVGAGVIGLSSAYALKLSNDIYDVTLIADNFSPQTTSDGAAGILKFAEGENGMKQTPSDRIAKWFTATYEWCNQIMKHDYSSQAGISRVSGYVLFGHEVEKLNLWAKLMPDGRLLNDRELERFGSDIKSGMFGTSVMCEGKRYLPWLLKRFQEKGGKVKKKRVNSFDELSDFDIVVNCTGLGSRELCNDSEIEPIRGQVMRMEAPWMRHFYHVVRADSPAVYIYPNIDEIVVGGTYQHDDNLEISEKDKEIILENAIKFEPSLKNAKWKRDWVGLRPSRSSVRLEVEEMCLLQDPGKTQKKIKVVHNYGHGPSGIALHWGSAKDAVKLVETCLFGQEKSEIKSKL